MVNWTEEQLKRVARLEEIEEESSKVSKSLGAVRNALSKQTYSKRDPLLLQQEQELLGQKDALIEERRTLKRQSSGGDSSDDSYSPYYDHRYGIRTDQ